MRFDALHIIHAIQFLVMALSSHSHRVRPPISCGITPCPSRALTPRRALMLSCGKRLGINFDKVGVVTRSHPSVNDTNLYTHIDSELPEPDRA
ncbi:hypothetical protein V8E53_011670 [Lactarius tabidus]